MKGLSKQYHISSASLSFIFCFYLFYLFVYVLFSSFFFLVHFLWFSVQGEGGELLNDISPFIVSFSEITLFVLFLFTVCFNL